MDKYTKYDSGTFIIVPCRGALVKLPPQSAYLFVWLANFNSDNNITPSVQTLCDLTGMSKNTVLKYMNILIERGLVIKEERKRADGAQLTNLYAINLNAPNAELSWKDIKKLSKKSENEIANMVQTVGGRGSNVCTGGVQTFEHKDKSYKDTPYKELSLHDNNIASSADATLAGVDKKEPMQVQSAVDENSSLSTIKNVYSGHSVKTQEAVSIDRIAMLKKGSVFNPAAYALVANLAKKLGSHEGKPSKKVLIALRSVITSNPKLVENNCDLFMKCAEQLALDDYQVNLGNNNVEFLLNHISKYLNLAVKGGVQTNSSNSQSKKNNRGAIFVKY